MLPVCPGVKGMGCPEAVAVTDGALATGLLPPEKTVPPTDLMEFQVPLWSP